MSELVEEVRSRIIFQIEQIDRLLQTYAELLERVQQREPDLVEVTAAASVLHAFYNGLENIFMDIAREIDRRIPSGLQWHRNLLSQVSHPSAARPAVIPIELAQRLADYLGFRHFYRHSYSFFLKWDKLEDLVISLPEIWTAVKKALSDFLVTWTSGT